MEGFGIVYNVKVRYIKVFILKLSIYVNVFNMCLKKV